MTAVERPPVTKMLCAILCTGRLGNGKPCDCVLTRIDIDHWEELLAASPYREDKCRKCGKRWHLADYR